MPRKPIHRKRQHGKRRPRAARVQRAQPAASRPPGVAGESGSPDRLATELREMLLTAVRNGELVLDDPTGPDPDPDGGSDWADADDWDDEYGEATRDFEPVAERVLLDAVEEILCTGSARPAADVARRLAEAEASAVLDLCPGDAPLIGEVVAVGILLGLRDGPGRPDATAAVRWVSHRLGAEAGRRALRVADLLGHPDAPPWATVRSPATGDEPLLAGLVLLLTGVAASVPG